MDENLEIEFKSLLTQDEYLTLRKALFSREPVKQVNVYYDNQAQELRQKRIMMRIRHKENSFDEFTLKKESDKGVIEYSFKDETIEIDHPKITLFLEDNNVFGPYLVIGKATTYRTTFIDDFGEWALDHTIYYGHDDYEIEYELFNQHVDSAKQRFLDFLDQYCITYNQSNPKFLRVLEYGPLKHPEIQID